MSDRQGSRSLEERISFLETRLQVFEERLSSLEGVRQDSTSSQEAPLNAMPEQKAKKVSPISVRLVSKNFHKADYMVGDAGDRIDFVLLFKSGLRKDVRAFKGSVVIKDLFDQEVMSLTLTHETGIRAGGTAEWKGGIQYNQFLAPHQRLLGVETKDAIVSFDLESVVYTDGTRESSVE